MTSPTLSVVVPTLNESARLPRLLASLEAAGLEPTDEVIVVDGGSADGTSAVARERGALALQAPTGRGAQLGHGGRAAQGEVLLFLHADMRVGPDALACVRAAFADPAVAAAGLRQRIDGKRLLYRWIECVANWRVRLGRVYGDSGLAVRRTVYEEVGGFRPLPLFEDLDLARRVRRAGRVRFLAAAELEVSARRWEQHGPVRQTLRNWCLTLAWLAGVEPDRLVRYYPSTRARARQTEPR